MLVAIWIIAICEIARALQNLWQIRMIKHDSVNRDNAYAEFIKSMKESDRSFVQKMLMEFEKAEERDGLKH